MLEEQVRVLQFEHCLDAGYRRMSAIVGQSGSLGNCVVARRAPTNSSGVRVRDFICWSSTWRPSRRLRPTNAGVRPIGSIRGYIASGGARRGKARYYASGSIDPCAPKRSLGAPCPRLGVGMLAAGQKHGHSRQWPWHPRGSLAAQFSMDFRSWETGASARG
jgi:hypothetical protein